MTERNLLGIKIFDTKKEALIEKLNNCITNNNKKIVFGISAAAYGRFKYRPDLYGIFRRMDIVVAEGAGIPALAKLFGVKISEKIGQVNLMYDLLKLANEKSYSVLLFGSNKETNAIAINKVLTKYPNIKECSGIPGYFENDDIPEIIKDINKKSPDILFIGISYPIKERFAVKYKADLNTKLIIPVGGAFEILAGNIRKPGKDFKKIPIAWLYRLLQEPKRMFKPILVTMLYSIFYVFPILLFRHYSRIERNPSIGRFFNLSGDEWNSDIDPVKI